MNKKYLDPEMNITLFESVDVITASGDPDTNLPGLDEDDTQNYDNLVNI
ncbi:MAG: hypothetical protein IJ027_02570 [Oscillospiraceae bacterium]|nr:hypothetical protein [Oscillospiraceae bacterium]